MDIYVYCLMPNHLHLILEQLKTKGISGFMSDILNSYTKYFNIKHERVGPLFQCAFKSVLIESDEQLLQTSRYAHLNPVEALLVPINEIAKYPWSSMKEYISDKTDHKIVNTEKILGYFKTKEDYFNFVCSGYQQNEVKIPFNLEG